MRLIDKLYQGGFLSSAEHKGNSIYKLKTPFIVRVSDTSVVKLSNEYLDKEEIGGMLWALPEINNGERVLKIDKISYIRNAIEDKEIYDKKTGRLLQKTNAYLPDNIEHRFIRTEIIKSGHLPIKFHTHPTKGKTIIQSLHKQSIQTDISDQDKKESFNIDSIDGNQLIIPRALIVGNKEFGNDLFVGVYGGFVTPENFDSSKSKIQQENIDMVAESVSRGIRNLNLTKEEKVIYGVGAGLLLIVLLSKFRKFSVPALLGLAGVAPLLLANTGSIDRPEYYNKLSFGGADIYIPSFDMEK